MPVTYSVTDRGYFVEVVASGRVTGEEFVRQKLDLAADQRVASGYSELCDTTGIMSLELKPDFFEQMVAAAEKCQEAHRLGRMAIVVNRADYFDLARQFERAVAPLGMTVIVFNHRDTALLWLGRSRRVERPLDGESARPARAEEPRVLPGRDRDAEPDDRGYGPRSADRSPPRRT